MTISNSVPALPVGASYTDNGDGTGSFSWTPTAGDVDSYAVTFAATEDNGAGQVTEQTITVDVLANQAPVIAPIGNQATSATIALNFTVTATDADGPAPIDMTISNSVPALPVGVQHVLHHQSCKPARDAGSVPA